MVNAKLRGLYIYFGVKDNFARPVRDHGVMRFVNSTHQDLWLSYRVTGSSTLPLQQRTRIRSLRKTAVCGFFIYPGSHGSGCITGEQGKSACTGTSGEFQIHFKNRA